MRVGFDVSGIYPWKAGVSTYATELLQHLRETPAAPDLVVFDAMGRDALSVLGETATFDRVRALPLLHDVAVSWHGRQHVERFAYRVDSFVLFPLWQHLNVIPQFARARLRRAQAVDVYHWTGETFLRVPGSAHVVTMHDVIPLLGHAWHNRGDSLNHVLRLRLAARYADRVIVDAESTKRDVERLLGVAPDRIDVIPLAANPGLRPMPREQLVPVVHTYGLEPGAYFVYLGTIEPRKNLVRLAAAFKALLQRCREGNVKLLLAGQRGWLTDEIDQGLRTLNLGDRLVMPGRVPAEHLPALLSGARAAVYVSLYEGFGLPPLESMACGTPVIVSNISSLPEVVNDCGLLVDPEDTAAISMAMERILSDDALHSELSRRSIKRAAQFSWDRTARMTIDTYCRALEHWA